MQLQKQPVRRGHRQLSENKERVAVCQSLVPLHYQALIQIAAMIFAIFSKRLCININIM